MSYGTKVMILRVLDLIIALGMIMLIIGMFLAFHQRDDLLKRVTVLSQQNHALSAENQELNTKTNDELRCLADLFARYTRDGQAVTIKDLDTCHILVTATSSPAPTAQTNSSQDNQTSAPHGDNLNQQTPTTTIQKTNNSTQQGRGTICKITLGLLGCK